MSEHDSRESGYRQHAPMTASIRCIEPFPIVRKKQNCPDEQHELQKRAQAQNDAAEYDLKGQTQFCHICLTIRLSFREDNLVLGSPGCMVGEDYFASAR